MIQYVIRNTFKIKKSFCLSISYAETILKISWAVLVVTSQCILNIFKRTRKFWASWYFFKHT